MGNPYALLLALVISFVDLLPILGTGTILIPWTLFCFVQRDYRQAMFLIILYGLSGSTSVFTAKDDSG